MNQQWPRVAQFDRHSDPPRRLASIGFEGAAAGPETTAEVADLLRILSRRRRAILATLALFVVPALLYSFLATPLYTAVSQILVDPRDRQAVTNDMNASAVAPDGGVAQAESQVRVIESDTVLLRAIAEVGLEADPEFGSPPDGLARRLLSVLPGLSPAPRDAADSTSKARALRNLRRRLAVKRADKVFVIDIVFTATSPEKAARIVNAIAKAYLADQAEARFEAAKRASAELAGRLDTLRADVNAAETRLETFKAQHGLIASSGQLVGEQQLTDNNARLVAARNRIAEAKSRLQSLREARGQILDPGATPEGIGSAVIERLRAQYAELTSREAELRTQLGPSHPAMAAIRTQRAEVQRLIGAETGRIIQAAEVEYRRAVENERLLAASLDRLQAQSVERGQANVQLRELEREVEASRSVYNTFLLRSREIGEQGRVDPTSARVITWARPPDERSWPLRLLIIGAALAGGLGGGAGLALTREYLRPTLLSRRQAESLLDAPVIATLVWPPALLGRAGRARAAFLLDSLLERREHGRGPASLGLLVSATEGDTADGRAVIELLADVAQMRGDRVLVVLARPGHGFLDVLRGEEGLERAGREDPGTGVMRIGIGEGRRLGRDAAERDGLRRALADIRRCFDLVLFEGGALSESPWHGPLAAAIDQHLAVARPGTTLQADLAELGKAADALRLPVSGALLLESRKGGR